VLRERTYSRAVPKPASGQKVTYAPQQTAEICSTTTYGFRHRAALRLEGIGERGPNVRADFQERKGATLAWTAAAN